MNYTSKKCVEIQSLRECVYVNRIWNDEESACRKRLMRGCMYGKKLLEESVYFHVGMPRSEAE